MATPVTRRKLLLGKSPLLHSLQPVHSSTPSLRTLIYSFILINTNSYPERVQPPPIFSDAKDSSDEHIISQSPMMVLEAQGRSVLDVNSMKTKRKSRNSGDSSRRRNRLTHIAL